MNVSHERIIQKMMDELEAARHEKTEQTIARHAANVQVLADLLVDNASSASTDIQNTQTNLQKPEDLQYPHGKSSQEQTINAESPDSIFDF